MNEIQKFVISYEEEAFTLHKMKKQRASNFSPTENEYSKKPL